MFDRRTMIGGAVLAAAAISTSGKSAPTEPPSRMTAGDRLNAFGPEAERLAEREGFWDVVETVWASPTASPVFSRGLVAERVMYGSMLQEILRTTADADRKMVARTDMLAYNRVEGRWGYVSFDTRAPVGLMRAWSSNAGSVDAISLIFAPFAVPGSGAEATGQLLHMDQTIRFIDAAHDLKDQYFKLADGTGTRWLAHRYAYQRK